MTGRNLLEEALLRRGYLCFQDSETLWLGTGSHADDLVVLGRIPGLRVSAVHDDHSRAARVDVLATPTECIDIALEIVAIPGNRGTTGSGLGGYVDYEWRGYRAMKWGAKVPVCPDGPVFREQVNGALDLGVALLVKTLPLMRVSTAWSCDGHGRKIADVSLYFRWCAPWARAIIDSVGFKPLESGLSIKDGHIRIGPRSTAAFLDDYWTDDFRDTSPSEVELRGMLNDIQRLARLFMNQRLINVVGLARKQLIADMSRPDTLLGEQFFYETALPILTSALGKANLLDSGGKFTG